MKKKDFGKRGEEVACGYLKKKGYEIIERNFCIRGGEIDIIAKLGDAIIFIEVKTRKNENWQPIEESITDSKIEFVQNTAEEWFFRKNHPETFWQIDFIGIIMGPNLEPLKIEHIEDVQ